MVYRYHGKNCRHPAQYHRGKFKKCVTFFDIIVMMSNYQQATITWPEGYFKQTSVETLKNRQYWVKIALQKAATITTCTWPALCALLKNLSHLTKTHKNTKTAKLWNIDLSLSTLDSTPRPLRRILNTKQQQQQINRSTKSPRLQRILAFARIGFVYFLILI